MNLQIPENVGNFLISWGSVSFSRKPLLKHATSSSMVTPPVHLWMNTLHCATVLTYRSPA